MSKLNIQKIIIISLLTLGGLAMFFPFYWMVLTSFKTIKEAAMIPPSFWVDEFTLANFVTVFEKVPFLLYARNTIYLVLSGVIGMLLCAMAGYGFAKYDFKHKEKIFLIVLATMMIPSQVNMIPVFLFINKIGLVNTFSGMALPGLVSAFGIFLFRQFFKNIPNEIIESARMEGVSELDIFLRIVLPMSKPIMAVQSIFLFIGCWNAFLWPLIIAQDMNHYTISIGLNLLQGQNGRDIPLQLAGATLVMVPVLMVFFAAQKHIMQSYNFSGSKG